MTLCPRTNSIPLQSTHDGGPIGSTIMLAGLGIATPTIEANSIGTWIIEPTDPDPIRSIERVIAAYQPTPADEAISDETGWLIMLSYELGRQIEPKAQHNPSGHQSSSQTSRLDTPGERTNAFPAAVIQRYRACPSDQLQRADGYTAGSMRSSMGKSAYIAAVERTQAYIGDGDLYQANIAHHLSGSFTGCARSCFADLASAADPRYGSMMIFDYHGVRHAIGSISPELYLAYDPVSGIISTEPMKGTRPIGADERELRDSIKDRAELDMITDLMRNDLGRLCIPGSIRVVDPRRIESHRSGVLQASSIIEGRVALGKEQAVEPIVERGVGLGVGLGEIINATFPPGSVTGAPKVRAMQIIDELEHHPRNAYCGAMLVMDDTGSIKASVSIRTAHIKGVIDPNSLDRVLDGRLVYPVGAGVVADSVPADEWAETLIKAAVLHAALGIRVESGPGL